MILLGFFVLFVSVMTQAHVKMLDDYSKEANGPNYTLRRQQEHNKESSEHLEHLRKVLLISGSMDCSTTVNYDHL